MYDWQKGMLQNIQSKIDETVKELTWAEHQLKAALGSKKPTKLIAAALQNVIASQTRLELTSRIDFTPFLKGEENDD
jgi:hypothetical protein|tara:strand:+ start:588 stop:818 length:231 start_codon:yes stop_codon:yes gene_type:complete